MSEMVPQIGVCFEDTPKVLMSRIVGAAATPINQASVDALSYLVKSYANTADAETDTNGTVVTAEAALSPVSSFVYNTLQTDNDWLVDEIGYNFKMTVGAVSFPTKGLTYRTEVWVNPTAGDDFLGGAWILVCKATARD
ncbi:MAG: hypothetical protein L0Z53_22885 [Acidobacteriales bacterium]|nr:hypothetical protein [Terriglobales bacterium]